MADQISGFLVVMEKDIPCEDSEQIISAIKLLKGVVDVKQISKEPLEKRIEKSRIVADVKREVMEKLSKI